MAAGRAPSGSGKACHLSNTGCGSPHLRIASGTTPPQVGGLADGLAGGGSPQNGLGAPIIAPLGVCFVHTQPMADSLCAGDDVVKLAWRYATARLRGPVLPYGHEGHNGPREVLTRVALKGSRQRTRKLNGGLLIKWLCPAPNNEQYGRLLCVKLTYGSCDNGANGVTPTGAK